ncbi:hypothetical protein [Polaromonas jejuensis]|uniref:Phage replication protein O n=1 Tax=Polaromonas jejuensis TaxID=457502 RepID=A0ABW0QHB7_9BURK|nr:hypothetical protein [Polaromonas jejuensis]
MDNEELAELEPMTRLLFVYLWMLADREGRLEDRPKRIAAQALAYDRAADVGAMLGDLQSAGFIARYVVGGTAVIQIVNFTKHQAPHVREAASTLPEMGREQGEELPKHNLGSAEAPPGHNLGSAEASPRSPDSGFLIPDSGLGTAQDKPAVPSRKAKGVKTGMPAEFGVSDRVKAWAKEKGFDRLDEHLDAFKRKVAAKGYTNVSWDDAFMEAVREDWAKLRVQSTGGAWGGRPQPAQVSDVWHESAAGVDRKAAELGLTPIGSLESRPVFRARVLAAAKKSEMAVA